jgi:hypothetical protein
MWPEGGQYVPKGKVVPMSKVLENASPKTPALGKTGKAHRRALKVQRRMAEAAREIEALEMVEHYEGDDWGGF